MKVTVNFDCTPEEARAFMGLPDVKPMQEALLAELEQQMRANMQAMTPQALLNTWLPAGLQGAEQMQKMFLSQLQNMMSSSVSKTADKK